MGKKKTQKTKQVSVAIAEASPTGDESQQQQQQPHTPRRRGRPRKIVHTTAAGEDGEGTQSKKAKTDQLEQHNTEDQPLPPAAIQGNTSTSVKKVEGQSDEKKLVRELISSRSKASRKSKPRKSS